MQFGVRARKQYCSTGRKGKALNWRAQTEWNVLLVKVKWTVIDRDKRRSVYTLHSTHSHDALARHHRHHCAAMSFTWMICCFADTKRLALARTIQCGVKTHLSLAHERVRHAHPFPKPSRTHTHTVDINVVTVAQHRETWNGGLIFILWRLRVFYERAFGWVCVCSVVSERSIGISIRGGNLHPKNVSFEFVTLWWFYEF